MEPAAVSTSHKSFPLTGRIICDGSCSGSSGPSRTPLSASALSTPAIIKITLAALFAAGAVKVMRSVKSLPTQLRVTTRFVGRGRPVCLEATEDCYARNRRVEVIVQGP